MFEVAELEQTVSTEEFQQQVPRLRERLLEAQARLQTAGFPVIMLFAGVDGAGKGETANLLSEWLDPHWIVTHAFGAPTAEEQERPEFWRYWRDLPPKGHLGIFLSAWYSEPLLLRAFEEISSAELDERLDKIVHFERTLVDDGALLLKFWMHLGKDQQEQRLTTLSADPTSSWRVTDRDWKHWRMYDKFAHAAEQMIMRTSTGEAPWTIVEGLDARFRSLKVGTALLGAIESRLDDEATAKKKASSGRKKKKKQDGRDAAKAVRPPTPKTVLSRLDLGSSLAKQQYREELEVLQARLNLLHRGALERRRSTIMAFEGWDAAGKGGAIRRITAALDARHCHVIMIGAPTDEELAHHYLWRFWRHLPRAGRVTIFDRSWYGRVLVERVEGFATQKEWQRAYAEINEFERELVEHGMVVMKFWIHISKREQTRRFKAREKTAYKRWKLTAEDWRNREHWNDYELAVNDMIERTSTTIAPWTLVEGDDKRFARVKVLRTVCERLEQALGMPVERELQLASGVQ